MNFMNFIINEKYKQRSVAIHTDLTNPTIQLLTKTNNNIPMSKKEKSHALEE